MRNRLLLPLLLLLIAAYLAPSAHAANLYTYDLDSLVFDSTDIVRATVTEQQSTGAYSAISTITIDETIRGEFKRGDSLQLPDLTSYRIARDELSKSRGVAKGDPVFLFLAPPKQWYQSTPKPKLVLIGSGIKLVDGGKVIGFRQYMNPGPYQTEKSTGKEPDPEAYRKQIEQSIAYVQPIADRLRQPAKAVDAPWLLQLLQERAKRPISWGDRDSLTEAACVSLAETHDLAALADAIQLPLEWSINETLLHSFHSPQGRAYLVGKLSEPITHTNKAARLRYAKALTGDFKLPATETRDEHWLERLAELAIDSSQHDDQIPASILLRCLQKMTSSYHQMKQSNAVISNAVTADLTAALTRLRDAFDRATMETQYAIDCVVLQAPGDMGFASHCGPVASILRAPTSEMHHTPAPAGQIMCCYEFFVGDVQPPRMFGTQLVFEEVGTGKQTVEPFKRSIRSNSAGGDNTVAAPVPPQLPRGEYRVFLRITDNGATVGDGYGETREISK